MTTDRTPQPGEAGAPDLSQPMFFPYLVGVYLGVNALPDVRLIVDGPDCSYWKTEYIHGMHDAMATLNDVAGHHRITNTALHPYEKKMLGSWDDALGARIRELARHEGTSAVLVSAMPMAVMGGVDYDRLCAQAEAETGRPVVHVPGRSLRDDWLGGYATLLDSLAARLPEGRLPATPAASAEGATDGRPRVGIVGLLFDRNEGDGRGNVREIERLVGGAGAKVSSLWLSGRPWDDLDAIRTSDVVVSLPYGRAAAKTVARRLEVPLVELDLPIGLGESERFVREVAAAVGRDAVADVFVEAELRRVVPRIEPFVDALFLGRRVGFVGDPHTARGVADLLKLLGAELSYAVLTCQRRNAGDPAALGVPQGRVLVEPTQAALQPFLSERWAEDPVDLVVTNTAQHQPEDPDRIVELGFPSPFTHRLLERPYLGFDGALALVETLANTLRWQDRVDLWATRGR